MLQVCNILFNDLVVLIVALKMPTFFHSQIFLVLGFGIFLVIMIMLYKQMRSLNTMKKMNVMLYL